MLIETIKYYIQSANVNILYGSGLSRPYLAVLGDIERWLTELNEKRSIDGNQTKYSIVEASILKQYYETVIEPNLNPKGSDYEKTIKEYRQFLLTLNELINKRSNRLVGKQVNLFTTNIDTLMERASAGFGVELNDGFQGSITQVFDAGNFQKTVSKVSLHFQNVSELPVFNLLKMHGSINWQNDGDRIRNDMSLQQVMAIREALDSIDSTNFISTRKTDPDTGEIMEKTLSEMLVEAEDKHISNKYVFSPFLESYHKLVMINPTKRKFRESVLDHHFYELMRQYSNNLEKENTLLFVAGFSFADEHIADITRRAANTNPTLHVVVFAFNDEEGEKISANLKVPGSCLNNNITVLTPSGVKEPNTESQDSKYEEFVDKVIQFNFETMNRLFELISEGIVTYGCK